METNYESIGLCDLTEKEKFEIDGGTHWEMKEGILTLVDN